MKNYIKNPLHKEEQELTQLLFSSNYNNQVITSINKGETLSIREIYKQINYLVKKINKNS